MSEQVMCVLCGLPIEYREPTDFELDEDTALLDGEQWADDTPTVPFWCTRVRVDGLADIADNSPHAPGIDPKGRVPLTRTFGQSTPSSAAGFSPFAEWAKQDEEYEYETAEADEPGPFDFVERLGPDEG